MSSKTTGEYRGVLELTATMRAPRAAASARCSPLASAKWPRWLTANRDSQRRAMRCSAGLVRSAPLISRCSGPSHAAAKGRDRSLVGQVEPDGGDVRIAGGGGDAGRGALAGGQVADRE